MTDHSLNGIHVQHKMSKYWPDVESAPLCPPLRTPIMHQLIPAKTFGWLNVKPITSEQVPQSALYNVMLES